MRTSLDSLRKPSYLLSIYFRAITTENAAVGTKVVEVSATDEDQGLNGKVTYKIISGNKKGKSL